MRHASFDSMNCSIARSLDVIGDWWTPLILRDALFGITRFDDFEARLGISPATLSRRLDGLVDAGVLVRVPYEASRQRHDYHLTDRGRDLWNVVAALREWGDRWISGPGNEPVLAEHDHCGGRIRLRPVCDECGEVVERSAVVRRAGPGLTDPHLLPETGDVH
jgi:DNA-binding HxlR family transcriptional regulator